MPVTEKATSRTAQAARQRVFTRGFSLGADAQSELWKRPRHRVGSTQVGRGTSGAFYFLRGIFFFCFFFFKQKMQVILGTRKWNNTSNLRGGNRII